MMLRLQVAVMAGVCLVASCARAPELREKAPGAALVYTAAHVGPGALGPGRIVSVYGVNIGPAQPCHGSADPTRRETPSLMRPVQTAIETQVFPTKLCDAEVEVGGVPAGLLFASAGQINFKVPQAVRVSGETTVRVRYKGQAGPLVSVALGPGDLTPSSEALAASMWAGLQSVAWMREYGRGLENCVSVRPHVNLQGGLYGHAYHCGSTREDVVVDSFFFPVDPAAPKVRLMRADVRPVNVYPELSAEVEGLLAARLTTAYGPGAKPGDVFEIGVWGRERGRVWRAGPVTIFLHRNRRHVEPVGLRDGVVLVAVREEILAQRRPVGVRARELPEMVGKRSSTAAEARSSFVRLMRGPAEDREQRAEALVAADELARRLGGLLVKPEAAAGADQVRRQLAAYGVRYGEIGHYSGELEYDYSLLARAWKEFPETRWGQRAFLELQRMACATKVFGCERPNCFRAVIDEGERFLERYPDSAMRVEQLFHLALAHDTWWSLAQAPPGDTTAEGAKVTKASAEWARVRAIELYEELLRVAPGTHQAASAEVALPRLKLRLDTAERSFFCYSC